MVAPQVSVVIPAYNSERLLAAAIESVLTQVGAPPFEVIVVDDGSTDGTAELAERFAGPVAVIRQANQGVSWARMTGAKAAKGQWVLMLDADDLLLPDAISTLWRGTESSSNPTVVYADYARLLPDGTVQQRVREFAPQGYRPIDKAFQERVAAQGTAIIDRGLLLLHGFPQSPLPLAEDFEMWGRLATQGDFLYVPKVVLLHRRHATQRSSRWIEQAICHLEAQKRLLKYYRQLAISVPEKQLRQAMYARLLSIAKGLYWNRRGWVATRLLLRVLRESPADLSAWWFLLKSLLPLTLLRSYDRRAATEPTAGALLRVNRDTLAGQRTGNGKEGS